MPEGHTIHRLARDHAAVLVGRQVRVSSPQGRFAEAALLLDRRRLTDVEAWGKHLYYHFGRGHLVHVHLGLAGRFDTWTARPAPAPLASVRLRLDTGAVAVDLRGPAACELVTPADREALLARLGPDLLRADADPERAWARVSRSRAPIGVLLLDQSVMAGVGNVYRAEALFATRLHPAREGRTLARAEFDRLWATLRDMLERGVRDNRIVTYAPGRAHRGPTREGERTWIYGRDACRVCDGPVERVASGARDVYVCPRCQARP